MKTNFKMMAITLSLLATTAFSVSYAKATGGDSGGGGDASEARVDEIREDILNWIDNGGAKGLKLPATLNYNTYVSEMRDILEAQKVVVKFIDKDSEVNEELKVIVNGSPKTCRGFYSKIDGLPHILCSIPRFAATSDSEQYKLIHHEYAGLKNIERNDKAASDYSLSSQITEYLSLQTVLKLAVKKSNSTDNSCKIYSEEFNELKSSKLSETKTEKAQDIEKLFEKKGYKFVSNIENASIEMTDLRVGCKPGSVMGKDGCYEGYAVIEMEVISTKESFKVGKYKSSWSYWYVDEGYQSSLKKAVAEIPKCIK